MQIHLEKLRCTLFFYPAVFISDLLQTSVSYFLFQQENQQLVKYSHQPDQHWQSLSNPRFSPF